jgi:hypothetical protein
MAPHHGVFLFRIFLYGHLAKKKEQRDKIFEKKRNNGRVKKGLIPENQVSVYAPLWLR